MKYTIDVKKGTYDRPIGKFDEKGHPVYDKHEHYDIDVLDVNMQSSITNEEDVKELAESLYPEVIQRLGDNPYIGVSIMLERRIKTLFSKDESLNDFQRALRRQYSAMKLDLDVFGLGKENN